ncbi:hypothetical protein D9C73_010498 [Collichthys lucidus]|uniref:Uncharacterized protein n=1 Tax=Collichthys lucidus TaxID=240159 RepID=A0A4U5UKK9_COLLU|nr:hypothetical protein D9C73_010498 [Collichthys lucidus]
MEQTAAADHGANPWTPTRHTGTSQQPERFMTLHSDADGVAVLDRVCTGSKQSSARRISPPHLHTWPERKTTGLRNKISLFENTENVETTQDTVVEARKKKALYQTVGNFEITANKAEPEVPVALVEPSIDSDEAALVETASQVDTTTVRAAPEVPVALVEQSSHTDEAAIDQVQTIEQVLNIETTETEQKLSEDIDKKTKMLEDEVSNRQAATGDINVKLSDLEDVKVKQALTIDQLKTELQKEKDLHAEPMLRSTEIKKRKKPSLWKRFKTWLTSGLRRRKTENQEGRRSLDN